MCVCMTAICMDTCAGGHSSVVAPARSHALVLAVIAQW